MKYTFERVNDNDSLMHYGIKGMKWRKRRKGKKLLGSSYTFSSPTAGKRVKIDSEGKKTVEDIPTKQKTPMFSNSYSFSSPTTGKRITIDGNGNKKVTDIPTEKKKESILDSFKKRRNKKRK